MLANDIGEFFVQKVENIRSEHDLSDLDLKIVFLNEPVATNACFDSSEQQNEENVKQFRR